LTYNDNKTGTVYIIGAGLSGLAAAVSCVLKGYNVQVFESTSHAGGRCRSYNDKILDRTINNGTHLILSGNHGVNNFIASINAGNNFNLLQPVSFNFQDIKKNENWSIRPSRGRVPWWIFSPSNRIPGTALFDYLSLVRLKFTRDQKISNLVKTSGPIFDRLWQPLSQAVLNTDAYDGSSASMWTMLSKTLLKGSSFCQPLLAKEGLSAALINPAVYFLKTHKTNVRYYMTLQNLKKTDKQIESIVFNKETINLTEQDRVILAIPPNVISNLLPDIQTPKKENAIVNVHFRLNDRPALPNNAPFIGIIGGNAHWLFKHKDIYSITISAANDFARKSNKEISEIIWKEVAKIIGDENRECPVYRIIREKRATFSQTSDENCLRPDSRTKWKNLFLAGDWTNTGLPATIESAVISGQKVAEIVHK
jgi:squalene-associated FAD-dependent desaturase